MVTPKEKKYLEVYEAESDAVFRFIYFKLMDRERAEDIVQEAFVRTWEYLEQGKTVGNLRAFVYRVANNILVDFFRKKKELSLDTLRDQGFDASFSPLPDTENALDVASLRSLMEKLDPMYRDAVILRHINDLSVKEIAFIIHETENATSVRIHRGLQKLRLLADIENRKKQGGKTTYAHTV